MDRAVDRSAAGPAVVGPEWTGLERCRLGANRDRRRYLAGWWSASRRIDGYRRWLGCWGRETP